MSTIAREDVSGGIRERLHFARLLLAELRTVDAGQGTGFARGLALRGAVIMYLYAALTGVLHLAARQYRVTIGPAVSLDEFRQAFAAAAVDAPAMRLLDEARQNSRDPLTWLMDQLHVTLDGSSLRRRPVPVNDEAPLAMNAVEESGPLSETDRQRLEQCVTRVETLVESCFADMDEW